MKERERERERERGAFDVESFNEIQTRIVAGCDVNFCLFNAFRTPYFVFNVSNCLPPVPAHAAATCSSFETPSVPYDRRFFE